MVMYEILSDKRPVANTTHTCWWCKMDIHPGTRYRYSTQKIDNDYLYTLKSHLECEELMDKLKLYHNQDYYDEPLIEYASDYQPQETPIDYRSLERIELSGDALERWHLLVCALHGISERQALTARPE